MKHVHKCLIIVVSICVLDVNHHPHTYYSYNDVNQKPHTYEPYLLSMHPMLTDFTFHIHSLKGNLGQLNGFECLTLSSVGILGALDWSSGSSSWGLTSLRISGTGSLCGGSGKTAPVTVAYNPSTGRFDVQVSLGLVVLPKPFMVG